MKFPTIDYGINVFIHPLSLYWIFFKKNFFPDNDISDGTMTVTDTKQLNSQKHQLNSCYCYTHQFTCMHPSVQYI